MTNRETRRTGILLGGILVAILFAVGMKRTQSVEEHTVKPYEIQCIRISGKLEHMIKEPDNEAEIKQLGDILNRTICDEDMNDRRNIKMTAEEYAIKIIYRDDNRIYVRLQGNLMRTNQIWYRLDRRDRERLKEIW